jgi:hypothetical protein
MPKAIFITPYSEARTIELPEIDGEVMQLVYDTGEVVTVLERDRQFENAPVLDEEGEPTGETRSVFAGWGEPYEVEKPVRAGGIEMRSDIASPDPNTAVVQIHSTQDNLDLLMDNDNWTWLEDVEEDDAP